MDAWNLLEIRHIKNPESLVQVGEGLYEHTNKRGITKQYRVYDTFKHYAKSPDYNEKCRRVSGFCIVEKIKGGGS